VTLRAADAVLQPELLDQARALTARARMLADSAGVGVHRSRRLGGGSEFSEHKEYAPGDDLRRMDWKVYGRTDRHVVKRFESDRQVEVIVVLDRSGSMGFGTTAGLPVSPSGVAPPEDKWDAARTLGLALAFVFLRQGDRVGLALVDGSDTLLLPPRGGDRQLHEMARQALARPAGGDSNLGEALQDVLGRHPRALVILASDLLCESIDDWRQSLAVHRARGRMAWVLHIVDPAEIDFPYDEPTRFTDLEGLGELGLNPRELAATYRQEFNQFLNAQTEACLDASLVYHRVRTDEPLDAGLLAMLRG
jgi:uncharacterized protein (DUF58 family)